MIKKLLIPISALLFASSSYADCMFKLMNYTDSSVTVKVGFYKGESEQFVAEPASTTIRKIANANYVCNSSSPAGIGVVYFSFVNDPDHAGAIYLPRSSTIKLKGDFTGAPDGRFMRSDNGNPIWLNTTDLAIDEEVFELKLNFTGRPNSRSAGTQ